MPKSKWYLVFACLVSSFVGGAASNWALSARRAEAQGVGADRAPVLTVSALRVVNPEGKLRASLRVLTDGTPNLELYDQNGKFRAFLHVPPTGDVGLGLCDQTERVRASFRVLADGSPNIGLYDQNEKNEKPRAFLRVLADGDPALVLSDKDGGAVFSAP